MVRKITCSKMHLSFEGMLVDSSLSKTVLFSFFCFCYFFSYCECAEETATVAVSAVDSGDVTNNF